MTTKKRRTKKSTSEQHTTEATISPSEKLNVDKVSVVPTKLPPNKRLFPVSLLQELDEIKTRLDKLEQAIRTKTEI